MIGILAFVGGVFAWTFIEYGMHNWNGHMMKGRTEFSREHLAHHAQKDYFATIGEKIRGAAPISLGIFLFGGVVLGWLYGSLFSAGVLAGYIFYDRVHHQAHVLAPRNAYERWVRKHHFSHHFCDAKSNHGVTTPIWDIVFRTYRKTETIHVPQRFVMSWLLDDSGEIKSEFRGDYELGRARRRRRAA